MCTLNCAIAIAAEAHASQVDKAGQPYILHSLRVMLRLGSEEERIVGVLHDVVEDCPGWTLDRLRQEGFPEPVLVAIESVTKRNGESYEAFVQRAGADPIGRAVKLADLADNMDRTRLAEVTPKDEARLARYARAVEALR